MAPNHRHADAATLMGAWPFSPHPDGASVAPPAFQPEVALRQATIRSIKREPSAGYLLDGLAFYIYIDSGGPFTVNFSGGDPWTLDDVVAEINTDTTVTVAYNENGFLLLKSPTANGDSYLRLASFPTAEHVFDILGLFAETESYAGDPVSPGHPDPTRQVSLPGQATMPWGGAFDASVFNRMAIALAVNSDRTTGLLDRKRVAVRKEVEITYNGTDDYLQILDTAYVGQGSPRMEDLVAILDDNHNEILVEQVITENVDTSGSSTVITDADSGEAKIFASDPIFAGVSEYDDWYVVFTLATSPLNGLQLKVLRADSNWEAIIQNIDPTTGERVALNGTFTALKAQQVSTDKVTAEGLYDDSSFTNKLTAAAQYHEVHYSGALSRIEKNNRIFVDAATSPSAPFTNVVAGDLVEWSGTTEDEPWYNDGTYRVLRKIDDRTIELCDVDGGPVTLNPVEPSPSGTIEVKTDGEFWYQPYIKFVDNDVKPQAGTVRVVYLGASTVRGAMTSDPAAMAQSVRYAQEAEFQVQKAIIGIAGPSMDTFDDALNWLYGDRRRSLEGAFARIDYEHHTPDTGGGDGRHADIRPDTIDMFPGVAGITATFRNADAAEDAGTLVKLGLKNSVGTWKFTVNAQGNVSIGGFSPSTNELYIRKDDQSVTVAVEANGTAHHIDMYAYTEEGQCGWDLYAGGTSRAAYVDIGTDSGYWDIWTEAGDVRNTLHFDDLNGLLDVLALDSVNGRVGIGTAIPSHTLQVYTRGLTNDALMLEGGPTQSLVQQRWRTYGANIGYIQGQYIGAGDYDFKILAWTNAELQLLTETRDVYIEPAGDTGNSWAFDTNGDFVPRGNPGSGEFQDVGTTSHWVQNFVGRYFYGVSNSPTSAGVFVGTGFSTSGVFGAKPAFYGEGGSSNVAGKDGAPGAEYVGGDSNATGGEPGHGTLSTGGDWTADATGAGGIGVVGFGGNATTGSTGTKGGGVGGFFKGGLGDTGNSGTGLVAYPGADGGGWAMGAMGYGGVIHPGSAGGGLLAVSGEVSKAAVDATGFTNGTAVKATVTGSSGTGVEVNNSAAGIGIDVTAVGNKGIYVAQSGASSGFGIDVAKSNGADAGIRSIASGTAGLAGQFISGVGGFYSLLAQHNDTVNANSSAFYAYANKGYGAVLETPSSSPERAPLRIVPKAFGTVPSNPQVGDIFTNTTGGLFCYVSGEGWVQFAVPGKNYTFTNGDGDTVTVVDGHITNISP